MSQIPANESFAAALSKRKLHAVQYSTMILILENYFEKLCLNQHRLSVTFEWKFEISFFFRTFCKGWVQWVLIIIILGFPSFTFQNNGTNLHCHFNSFFNAYRMPNWCMNRILRQVQTPRCSRATSPKTHDMHARSSTAYVQPARMLSCSTVIFKHPTAASNCTSSALQEWRRTEHNLGKRRTISYS